jgi:hypothetical protein
LAHVTHFLFEEPNVATMPRDAGSEFEGVDEDLAGDADYDTDDDEWEIRAHEQLRRFRDHDPDERGSKRPRRRRRREP